MDAVEALFDTYNFSKASKATILTGECLLSLLRCMMHTSLVHEVWLDTSKAVAEPVTAQSFKRTVYDNFVACTLPGQQEGQFAWLSANYLVGTLQDVNPTTTVSTLEMGGASLQVC